MTKWLISAEVDRIQDIIFRSSRLREVVGGSMALTRICREGARELLLALGHDPKGALVVADGGSFTVILPDRPSAEHFGRVLAELLRERVGGSLTVAPPVEIDDGLPEEDWFPKANAESRQRLALNKRCGRPAAALAHAPYVALCASCGRDAATAHRNLHESEQANYVCTACRDKASIREELPEDYIRQVLGLEGSPAASVADRERHEQLVERYKQGRDVNTVAEAWDPRGYVAYIAADGNAMGEVFGLCRNSAALTTLSEALPTAVRRSVAAATAAVMATRQGSALFDIPMVLLISGGDDLFVRVPAPYALDFARRFCEGYEDEMGTVLERVFPAERLAPTCACAVVVCKGTYPHRLAHARCEALLADAKRLAKARAGPPASTVAFDVVLGSRIAGADQAASGGHVVPSMAPLFVRPEAAGTFGLSVGDLVTARRDLDVLPGGRLAQLADLFEPHQLPAGSPSETDWAAWADRMEAVLGRVRRNESQAQAMTNVLNRLGAPWADASASPSAARAAAFGWRRTDRWPIEGQPVFRHALPDLLRMWNYSHPL